MLFVVDAIKTVHMRMLFELTEEDNIAEALLLPYYACIVCQYIVEEVRNNAENKTWQLNVTYIQKKAKSEWHVMNDATCHQLSFTIYIIRYGFVCTVIYVISDFSIATTNLEEPL